MRKITPQRSIRGSVRSRSRKSRGGSSGFRPPGHLKPFVISRKFSGKDESWQRVNSDGARTTPCSRHCEAASQSIADLSAGSVAEAIYVLRLRSLSRAREITSSTSGMLPRNDGRGICLERILAMTSGITASSGRHPFRCFFNDLFWCSASQRFQFIFRFGFTRIFQDRRLHVMINTWK